MLDKNKVLARNTKKKIERKLKGGAIFSFKGPNKNKFSRDKGMPKKIIIIPIINQLASRYF